MPGRVVAQWNKDDVEDAGLIKIDLLGLGMLALVAEAGRWCGPCGEVMPAQEDLPLDDPEIYAMLCRGDAHRLLPGGEQGPGADGPQAPAAPLQRYRGAGGDHPARPDPWGTWSIPTCAAAQGWSRSRYLHPSLEPILRDTLGIVLYQEQIIQIATDVAGFTPGRGRPAAPRHEQQPLRAGDGGAARPTSRPAASRRALTPDACRRPVRPDPRLRPVRLLPLACRLLRPARLSVALAQALPPAALLLRAAQQPADGLLLPGRDGRRRPPPRGAHPAAGRALQPRSRCTIEDGALRLGYNYVPAASARAARRHLAAGAGQRAIHLGGGLLGAHRPGRQCAMPPWPASAPSTRFGTPRQPAALGPAAAGRGGGARCAGSGSCCASRTSLRRCRSLTTRIGCRRSRRCWGWPPAPTPSASSARCCRRSVLSAEALRFVRGRRGGAAPRASPSAGSVRAPPRASCS